MSANWLISTSPSGPLGDAEGLGELILRKLAGLAQLVERHGGYGFFHAGVDARTAFQRHLCAKFVEVTCHIDAPCASSADFL